MAAWLMREVKKTDGLVTSYIAEGVNRPIVPNHKRFGAYKGKAKQFKGAFFIKRRSPAVP